MRTQKKILSRIGLITSGLLNTGNHTSFWLLAPLFLVSILIGFITAVIDSDLDEEIETLTSFSIITQTQEPVERLTGDATEISSKVSGKVIGIYVKDNQFVKKGTLLFIIDPIPYKIALKEVKVALQSAQKQLHILSKTKTPDENSVKVIDEKIKSLEEAVRAAERNLHHSAIYAPFDGRIINLSIEPGEFIDAGIEVFTIVDTRNKFLFVSLGAHASRVLFPIDKNKRASSICYVLSQI